MEIGGLELQKRFQITSPPTLDITVFSPGETKNEDEESKLGPIVVISAADDYPDGGLAAWCVVLGVIPSIFPCLLGIADGVWSCHRPLVYSSRRKLCSMTAALSSQLIQTVLADSDL